MTRREPGGLEHEVLAAISTLDRRASVAEVQAALPGPSAYTTVMTTLGRLSDKGALRRVRAGRAYLYSLAAPVADVDDAVTARRMRRLLTEGSDRAGVLARFAAELDPEDRRLLTELLQRQES